MTFKKLKKKIIKIFVSFLLIKSLTIKSAQGAQLPGADGFPLPSCPRRETYSREATSLSERLKQNFNDGNIPRINKGRYDRHLPEFNCTLTDAQIQVKFKHANAFGIIGERNRENLELFKDKVIEHMKDPSTKIIEGKYKKNIKATHYLNENTGLNVMINATSTKFISGWKLGDQQLEKLKTEGDFF